MPRCSLQFISIQQWQYSHKNIQAWLRLETLISSLKYYTVTPPPPLIPPLRWPPPPLCRRWFSSPEYVFLSYILWLPLPPFSNTAVFRQSCEWQYGEGFTWNDLPLNFFCQIISLKRSSVLEKKSVTWGGHNFINVGRHSEWQTLFTEKATTLDTLATNDSLL